MHQPTQDENEEELVNVTLDAETLAHYEARAHASGRTLEEQILYEFKVNRGDTVPDPGDAEATQRGQLFRRMHSGRILQG